MNKIFGILVMIALLAVSAVAATSLPVLKVHAVDNHNNDLTGVVVAAEWKGWFFGWNDLVPKEKTTGSDGLTSDWYVLSGKQIQVNYATLEGYTCTRGEETRLTSHSGLNTLTTICTPNGGGNDVPEFGVIAAGIALLGAAGIIFVSRRQ